MDISEKSNREYTNGEITVYWQPKYCIHAGECFTRLPKVFKPTKKPWVDLYQAETEDIIKTVNACPTDALTFKWNKELSYSSDISDLQMNETIIKIKNKGPIIIKGKYKILDDNGDTIQKGESCALCGCGKSAKKPFCDGKHNI